MRQTARMQGAPGGRAPRLVNVLDEDPELAAEVGEAERPLARAALVGVGERVAAGRWEAVPTASTSAA
jgi:hypothetical protein